MSVLSVKTTLSLPPGTAAPDQLAAVLQSDGPAEAVTAEYDPIVPEPPLIDLSIVNGTPAVSAVKVMVVVPDAVMPVA